MPSNIANAYIGNTPLKAIYVGDKKVYPNAELFHARFDLSKGTSSTTLTLPFAVASSYANLTIDWGDGVTTTGTNAHTYASVGVYDVKVYGEMRDFRYNNTNQPQKLMRIINWGEFVISRDSVFYGCSNLVIDDLTNIPLVANANMNSIFRGCSSLTTIPLLNTSNVTNMNNMFYSCSILNVDLSELCVPLITSLPNGFITGAPLMTAEKLPVWGTCPNGENLLP